MLPSDFTLIMYQSKTNQIKNQKHYQQLICRIQRKIGFHKFLQKTLLKKCGIIRQSLSERRKILKKLLGDNHLGVLQKVM